MTWTYQPKMIGSKSSEKMFITLNDYNKRGSATAVLSSGLCRAISLAKELKDDPTAYLVYLNEETKQVAIVPSPQGDRLLTSARSNYTGAAWAKGIVDEFGPKRIILHEDLGPSWPLGIAFVGSYANPE